MLNVYFSGKHMSLNILRLFYGKRSDLETIMKAYLKIDLLLHTVFVFLSCHCYNCLEIVNHRLQEEVVDSDFDLQHRLIQDPRQPFSSHE